MATPEILKAIYAIKIRNDGAPSWETRLRAYQRGSILLGLIITMVVMAVLGAGMVYLTTTSTFQELMANSHARAYYLAESGGRYASSLAREALASGNPTSALAELNLYFVGDTGKTYTTANNETFQIRRWAEFSDAGSKVITFESIGTVGSGFLQAKRTLTYRINPAIQGAGSGSVPPPIPGEASEFQKPGGMSHADFLGQFFTPAANQTTQVFSSQFADDDYALNLSAYNWIIGLKWWTDLYKFAQLDKIRSDNNNQLSYGVQVKIKNYDQESPNPASRYNLYGISFRLDDNATATSTATNDNNYLISWVMLRKPMTNPQLNQAPPWYLQYMYNNSWDWFSTGDNEGKWFIVLWKMIYSGTGWTYTPLAYHKVTSADSVCAANSGGETYCDKVKTWSTLMVYIKEGGGTNQISGYIASTSTYPRRTITPLSLPPVKWAEKYIDINTGTVPDTCTDNTCTVPSILKPITWTKFNEGDTYPSKSTIISNGTSIDILTDNSLTTSNYRNDWIGDTSKTKAREIGLHIFYYSPNAQDIWYDNFYIDLGPSGYGRGYVDGSGQTETGP